MDHKAHLMYTSGMNVYAPNYKIAEITSELLLH